MPCTAGGLLDRVLVVAAEIVEVRVARDSDAVSCPRRLPGVAAHDLLNESGVSRGVGFRQLWFE